VPSTVEGVPALHRLEVGALVAGVLAAEPHTPSVAAEAVEVSQNTSLPLPLPWQAQAQGPEPLPLESVTDVAVPTLHRLVVGALLAAVPLAEPHTPLALATAGLAEHDAVLPPFVPAQLQLHGPEPLPLASATALAVPVPHRVPPEGAVLVVPPFAAPHTPLTGGESSCAEHEAVLPPFDPAQLQLHGPVPLTEDAVPALHRAVGVVLTVVPFAAPQVPLTGGGA
jgi:hypothetical protein